MSTNIMIMVLGIVLITTVGRLYAAKHGINYRSRRDARRAHRMGAVTPDPQPDPDAERMREEIRTLKERIAVLERIATDTNSAVSLDREIEKLR